MPVPSGANVWLSLWGVKQQIDVDDTDITRDALLQWYLDVATAWVTIKVIAGDITPLPVQEAILLVVAHLFNTQRGPAGNPLTDDPDVATQPFDVLTVPRVRELLEPYLPKPAPAGAASFYTPPPFWPDPIESYGLWNGNR